MADTRKSFSKEFKAKVAMEAFKGLKTTAELSSEYGVHATQITQWKNQLRENITHVFEGKNGPEERQKDQLIDKLYRQIGELQVQNEWLKKKLPF